MGVEDPHIDSTYFNLTDGPSNKALANIHINNYNNNQMEELNMSKQYTEEFKRDAVNYYKEHADIGIAKCAQNLGIGKTSLHKWNKLYNDNNGTVPTRGRGNYQSDEAKENARLRKELRDTQDALEILKKAIGILGK